MIRRTNNRARKSSPARFTLENLENRTLMAADFLQFAAVGAPTADTLPPEMVASANVQAVNDTTLALAPSKFQAVAQTGLASPLGIHHDDAPLPCGTNEHITPFGTEVADTPNANLATQSSKVRWGKPQFGPETDELVADQGSTHGTSMPSQSRIVASQDTMIRHGMDAAAVDGAFAEMAKSSSGIGVEVSL